MGTKKIKLKLKLNITKKKKKPKKFPKQLGIYFTNNEWKEKLRVAVGWWRKRMEEWGGGRENDMRRQGYKRYGEIETERERDRR